MMIKGQDWAKYQAEHPDVTGLDFAFTKVTEGLSYVNSRWVAQRDWAKSHGLVWGAYHYPHMANDPVAEADYFLSQVKWAKGDIIVLDWEGYDDANKGVSTARQLAYRDAWLKYVKQKMPDHKVGMYCNKSYWTGIDKTSNCGDFLWIATGGLPAGQPGIKYAWTFHQYSTADDIDHDVATFASRAALAEWAGLIEQENPVTDTAFTSVWKTDNSLPAGSTEKNTENKFWTAQTYLTGTFENTVQVLAQAKSNGTNISTLIAKVDKLAVAGIDLDALAVKVADLLAKRLQS
jgi:GH25 family lysozyme M1 (1,4-beta-N-acetylmuramidase)